MRYVRIPRPSYDKPGDKLWDKEYPRKRPDLDLQNIERNEDDYFEPAPRPKFCLWERGWFGPHYEADCLKKFQNIPKGRTCPSCSRPIKFTEAK